MNAKELRRAAEIVVSQYKSDTTSIRPAVAIELAAHVLSTVREDDDEEYCSDWARSVIGTSEVTLNERFSLATHRCDIEYDDLQPHQVSCGSLRTRVKTQGDFRTLCRLLGVTLKEEA